MVGRLGLREGNGDVARLRTAGSKEAARGARSAVRAPALAVLAAASERLRSKLAAQRLGLWRLSQKLNGCEAEPGAVTVRIGWTEIITRDF